MKKIIIFLISVFLFAEELYFEMPKIIDKTNTSDQNQTLTHAKNSIDSNITDTNLSQNSFLSYENNTTEYNTTNKENNVTIIPEEEITFEDNFVSLKPHLQVCVIIDKKKFFKYTPSIINSLNSYLIYKNIEYNLSVHDINEPLENITQNCSDILVYTLDKNYIKNLNEYNTTRFYIPIFNKNEIEVNSTNIYFGGIDYKAQINKLANFIDDNKAIAINENTALSNKLFNYETELNLTVIPYEYPNINYNDLNNSYVFFNTRTAKTAQVLSKITYKELETKLQLAPQINYDPLLIGITQPDDVKKLLIANSIINPPLLIEDYNLLVDSDIKYNWLNYSSNILLNKIYNLQTGGDEFYMNDFKTYIFDNQILYKIKLYQIINGAFKPIEY
jgi:hypothetical protein